MPAVIKKYVNRKLHREGDSSYISMLEVADAAVEDPKLKVICDRTGRDLTVETLTRALYERTKDHANEARYMETGRNRPMPFTADEIIRLLALFPPRKKVG
jgi:polyhydroxyalkanoate synthesis regulator protein